MKPYFKKHIRNFLNVIRVPQKMFFEKNNIAKNRWEADHIFSWNQEKVVDREIRLIPRIWKTINSLRNPNDTKKFFSAFIEIWRPNLG